MTIAGVGGTLTAPGGTLDVLAGATENFKSYASGVWSAYTGMWGVNIPANDKLIAKSTMVIRPKAFPLGTVFTWDVTRDPDWAGVNGFLHLAWGNYDWSPGSITPRQVSGIADLGVTIDWEFTGDTSTGLLCECWLSPAAAASGDFTKSYEVGFHPKVSSLGPAYFTSLPVVGAGSFVDSNGVSWNVREDVAGTGQPYFVAYRPGYVDFKGQLRFDDLFAFLVGAGKITASSWFNGLAFGAEPHGGAGSVTIKNMSVLYAAGSAPANVITNGTFAAEDAGWNEFWYSGKAVTGQKAVFTASPAFDGINQPIAVTAGKYYELTYTVSARSSGSVYGRMIGGTTRNGSPRTANGTYAERLLANSGNNVFEILLDVGGTLSVDDISLVGPYDTSTVGGA